MAAVRVIDPDELKRALSAGPPAPVYLLAGADGYRAERTARWLRERVLDEATADFNAQVLFGDETTPGAIAEAAAAYPMFGGHRFVWVKHAEALPSGPAVQPLLDYLANPAPSTVLVLTSSKLDKRLKLTAACAEGGCAVDFQPLSGGALTAQVRRQAKALGISLDAEAVVTLVELVGDDLGELDAELAKLALLDETSAAVNSDEIRALVARSRDLDAFTVADLLDRRNPLPALRAWMEMRAGGKDVIGTAAILSWRIRQLVQLRAAMETGRSAADAARSIGMPPWQARRLERLAQASDLAALERSLGALRTADRRAKSSSLGAPLAYDLALLEWALGEGPA